MAPDLSRHAVTADRIQQITDDWYYARTHCGHEEHVIDVLADAGAVPVPLRTLRRDSHRHVTVAALFAGYVFFAGGWQQRDAAQQCRDVIHGGVCDVRNGPRLAGELVALVMATAANPWLCARRLARGQQCIVTAGPLAGKCGIFCREKPGVIYLTCGGILGVGAEIEVPAEHVEVV